MKAGYAGDNVPRIQFPSLIGRPMLRAEEDYVGDITLRVVYFVDPFICRICELEMSVMSP